MDQTDGDVCLVDLPDLGKRNTCSNLASLYARLSSLSQTSGSHAAASIIAGYILVGREFSKTILGAQMRKGLEESLAGKNAHILWRHMRMADWISKGQPCPVLDQLRNDISLLLAEDLENCLSDPARIMSRIQTRPYVISQKVIGADPVDYMLGLWVYSRELSWAIENFMPVERGGIEKVKKGRKKRLKAGPLLR